MKNPDNKDMEEQKPEKGKYKISRVIEGAEERFFYQNKETNIVEKLEVLHAPGGEVTTYNYDPVSGYLVNSEMRDKTGGLLYSTAYISNPQTGAIEEATTRDADGNVVAFQDDEAIRQALIMQQKMVGDPHAEQRVRAMSEEEISYRAEQEMANVDLKKQH